MSTSLASLVADTITITNRPDLAGETALAVRSAVLKAHHSDDYIFDFRETGIAFDTAEYIQSFDYKSVLPLYRKARYARKYDNTGSTPGPFLTYLEPEKVIDSYGANRTDIFYLAGSNMQIRSSTELQYMLLGYYANPSVVETTFSSWIADDYPFTIIYDAAATIFKSTGLDAKEATFRGLTRDALGELTKHAITGIGS